ncbi:Cytidine deaminase 5 [Chamberlinius hualienensis]
MATSTSLIILLIVIPSALSQRPQIIFTDTNGQPLDMNRYTMMPTFMGPFPVLKSRLNSDSRRFNSRQVSGEIPHQHQPWISSGQRFVNVLPLSQQRQQPIHQHSPPVVPIFNPENPNRPSNFEFSGQPADFLNFHNHDHGNPHSRPNPQGFTSPTSPSFNPFFPGQPAQPFRNQQQPQVVIGPLQEVQNPINGHHQLPSITTTPSGILLHQPQQQHRQHQQQFSNSRPENEAFWHTDISHPAPIDHQPTIEQDGAPIKTPQLINEQFNGNGQQFLRPSPVPVSHNIPQNQPQSQNVNVSPVTQNPPNVHRPQIHLINERPTTQQPINIVQEPQQFRLFNENPVTPRPPHVVHQQNQQQLVNEHFQQKQVIERPHNILPQQPIQHTHFVSESPHTQTPDFVNHHQHPSQSHFADQRPAIHTQADLAQHQRPVQQAKENTETQRPVHIFQQPQGPSNEHFVVPKPEQKRPEPIRPIIPQQPSIEIVSNRPPGQQEQIFHVEHLNVHPSVEVQRPQIVLNQPQVESNWSPFQQTFPQAERDQTRHQQNPPPTELDKPNHQQTFGPTEPDRLQPQHSLSQPELNRLQPQHSLPQTKPNRPQFQHVLPQDESNLPQIHQSSSQPGTNRPQIQLNPPQVDFNSPHIQPSNVQTGPERPQIQLNLPQVEFNSPHIQPSSVHTAPERPQIRPPLPKVEPNQPKRQQSRPHLEQFNQPQLINIQNQPQIEQIHSLPVELRPPIIHTNLPNPPPLVISNPVTTPPPDSVLAKHPEPSLSIHEPLLDSKKLTKAPLAVLRVTTTAKPTTAAEITTTQQNLVQLTNIPSNLQGPFDSQGQLIKGEDQLQRPVNSEIPFKQPNRIRVNGRTTTRRPVRRRTTRRRLKTTLAPTLAPAELQQISNDHVNSERLIAHPGQQQQIQSDLQSLSSAPKIFSEAKQCDPSVCLLPHCYCGGNKIPGGLSPSDVPQMVVLTFDDSVNEINYGFYSSFLANRNNPNGCPISATFYVSHEWTDHAKVNQLYNAGHEIASHSISHSDGASFTRDRWTKEIDGQRRILSALSGIKLSDIKGMRAPFLQGGGNRQFRMLYDTNFTYDSSIPSHSHTWPYTLEYRMPHECGIPPCPTRSYPGVWEIPMVMWEDLNKARCSMADACFNPTESRGVYDQLVKNFKKHYTGSRIPFGMYYHYAWFTKPHQKEGFLAFLDALLKLPDVYFITNSQLIEWMRQPTPLSKINEFAPWQCGGKAQGRSVSQSGTCSRPKSCRFRFKGDERTIQTCQPCPEKFPWLETYDLLPIVNS